MFGKGIGNKELQAEAFIYVSDPNIYIFVVRDDGFVKMSGVSLTTGSPLPLGPMSRRNKYVVIGSVMPEFNSETVNKMWNGEWTSATKAGSDSGYAIKEVREGTVAPRAMGATILHSFCGNQFKWTRFNRDSTVNRIRIMKATCYSDNHPCNAKAHACCIFTSIPASPRPPFFC
jgi:hypothetical protein